MVYGSVGIAYASPGESASAADASVDSAQFD
jgi:hypothetical protein